MQFKKVIFVSKSGNCREVMAMKLFQEQDVWADMDVQAKGLVVLMPEPVNQKAEAVMVSHGLSAEGFSSMPLEEEDFSADTVVFTMESEEKEKLLKRFPNAQNVHVLTEATGEELEILDPYGGELVVYGLCFETMGKTIRKLVSIMNEGSHFNDEI